MKGHSIFSFFYTEKKPRLERFPPHLRSQHAPIIQCDNSSLYLVFVHTTLRKSAHTPSIQYSRVVILLDINFLFVSLLHPLV